MAKKMAVIESGLVRNVVWCSDIQRETESVKDSADRSIAVGDTYKDGQFYRAGNRLLTRLEAAREEIDDMRNALNIMGVNVNGKMDRGSCTEAADPGGRPAADPCTAGHSG